MTDHIALNLTDRLAQDLLWEYAQRRRYRDADFADDLETALLAAGFRPSPEDAAGRILADKMRAFWGALDAARRRWQQLKMRK